MITPYKFERTCLEELLWSLRSEEQGTVTPFHLKFAFIVALQPKVDINYKFLGVPISLFTGYRMMFAYVFVVVSVLAYTDAYSSGAPENACVDMVPKHPVAPQKSAAPYTITTSTKVIKI